MKSIGEIRGWVWDYGKKIKAPMAMLSVLHGPSGDGSPYVEIKGNHYYYVREERGVEFERKKTKDVDLLVYWLMRGVVSQMAKKIELDHRVGGQDIRKLWFDRELELMGVLNLEWRDRLEGEIKAILRQSPFSRR